MGNHGMKAVFSDSAYRSTSSALRSTRLYKVLHGDDVGVRARLLKLVDGRLGHADVADLASCRSSASSPSWSAVGTFSSMWCSWYGSMSIDGRVAA